jgi:cell division protein FtsW
LRFGPINVQPSELAKFATILLLSWWMGRAQRRAGEFRMGLLVPIILLGLIAGLIFIEPDFGTTLLIGCVGMVIMFVGGTRVGYLVIAAVGGGAVFLLAILQNEERMRRIFAFLNPDKYAQDEAFQLLNAIYAFVVGGGAGVGLGGSLQKQFYLPEAHTDFIFAIVGEELGLAASLGVVVLFLGFFMCGLWISLRAPDTFGRLVAFGITSMITLQAAINIGVVTGCLPTKGLPLPFISFGGTSIAITLAMVGVLVNIALQGGGEVRGAIRDKGHDL